MIVCPLEDTDSGMRAGNYLESMTELEKLEIIAWNKKITIF